MSQSEFQALAEPTREGDSLVVRVAGRWRITDRRPAWSDVVSGQTPPARLRFSAAGLEAWVAADQDGYEAMAIRMGQAPEALAERRRGLRAKVAASDACDTEGLCRALEAIYLDEVSRRARR